jgi:hypothetical protein
LKLFAWDEVTGTLGKPEQQSELPAVWNSTPESPAKNPVIFHASGVQPFDARLQMIQPMCTQG